MSLFSPLISAISGQSSNASLSGASQILGAGTTAGKLGSGSNAVANIQRTLDAAKSNANKQQIMAAVSLRIQGIAQGLVQPQEVWEKVAGFLTLTGQPFTYSVDDAGQVDVQPQSLEDLSFVNNGQREAMRQALERLDVVREKVDTVTTKANLRNTLFGAVARLAEMERHAPPKEQWERDFQVIKSTGRPVLVGLSPEGNLRAFDQLNSNFDYVEDPNKRAILQRAGTELQNIINGDRSATESWQFEALGNRLQGDDYFLDVDENNAVVVRRNKDRRGQSSTLPLFQQSGSSDFHIIPEFLKSSREDSRIFKESWEEQATALYQAKKPFHLELVGDRIVVRQTDFTSARRADLLNINTGNAKVGQSIVNIIS